VNAIINLGNPLKDFSGVAAGVIGNAVPRRLRITGVTAFSTSGVVLTSPAYGAGMTLDCLEELCDANLIDSGESLIFVGSMGSLWEGIRQADVVLPEPCLCAYYGFEGRELHQDPDLYNTVRLLLQEAKIPAVSYRHGSTFAVFDPHTDHKSYSSSLYDASVRGVDCGEVFIGLEFAERNRMRAAAVLYCSDSPETHITDIGAEAFGRTAAQFDSLLNGIAATAVRK
jgi:purine-nucleoside phosphorylase